jgi:hypothetical protein
MAVQTATVIEHDMAPAVAELLRERRDLLARTEVLIREFSSAASAGAVIATVSRCRDKLVRAGVRAGLAEAAESMARARLLSRAREA